MKIGILGPLDVRGASGDAVPISGTRVRRLLTRLAFDVGRAVAYRDLVDAVWIDDPPRDAPNALQSLVSRLRRTLDDPQIVEQSGSGYRLTLPAADVDTNEFVQRSAAGRRALAAGDHRSARADLDAALRLYRGTPLSDAGEAPYAVAALARWEEQRLTALGDRIAADLALGGAADVIGELDELVARFPLRERFADQLMTAFAQVGRTADALETYEALRRRLADELGADPGSAIADHHLALLRGERPAAAREPTETPRRRSNLRASVSSFVGRESELGQITGQVERARLTTIVGPGGAGKTRLATEAGMREEHVFRDGVWLVELAPITDGATIAQAVLASFGVRDTRILERPVETGASSATDRVLDTLADSDAMLVVDNCEHVIGAAAAFVEMLLARCPQLRVLATSREPLGIAGEAVVVIPPLGLPPADADQTTAATYPAVRLLLERGRAARSDFELDHSTVGAVVDIVRRLDGLPLAIELAAARLRVLPVTEIAERLSDRFRLLAGGIRTSVARHRTLRAVVEWSWELLTDAERLLAERLAVFPAGATEASATEVCAGGLLEPDAVGGHLMSLVDKSLLHVVAGKSATRYRMLETIREFGVERLDERGELAAARSAHARHFAREAARLDPLLRSGEQVRALDAMTAERDNMLAAVRYLTDSGAHDEALDLVFRLCWYWAITGSHTDTATWIRFVLDATEGIDSPARVRVRAARRLARVTGPAEPDSTQSMEAMQEELVELAARLAELDDGTDVMTSLLRLYLEFFGQRGSTADELMAALGSTDDPWLDAMIRNMHAMFLENIGQVDQLRGEVDRAYEAFEAIGDLWGMSNALTMRAGVRRLDGNLAGALDDYQRALDYVDRLGATEDNVFVNLRIAELYVRQGDFATAQKHLDVTRTGNDGAPMAIERTLLAESAEVTVLTAAGRTREAADRAAELRRRVPPAPNNPMFGHLQGFIGAACASAAVNVGDLATARADLDDAYPAALASWDRPLLAAVGVAVAEYAAAMGRHRDAAEILGAAAASRGADDPGDVVVRRVQHMAEAHLGAEGYRAAYAAGRGLDAEAAAQRIDPARLPAGTGPTARG